MFFDSLTPNEKQIYREARQERTVLYQKMV
jgi:hypothetical protein